MDAMDGCDVVGAGIGVRIDVKGGVKCVKFLL